jgi:mono/diheme cytochrome c family protein
VAKVPVPVTPALLERGQERFGIYCAVCHGLAGDGQGMVGVRWAAPVPSFHDPKYRDPAEPDGRGMDGFFFNAARNGVVRPDGVETMPGYAHALGEREVWAIVAYIRALQETRLGRPEDVPAERRDALDRERAALLERARAADGGNAAGGQP